MAAVVVSGRVELKLKRSKRCFLRNGGRDVLIKTPAPPTQLISFDAAARCVTSSLLLPIPELLACLIFKPLYNKLLTSFSPCFRDLQINFHSLSVFGGKIVGRVLREKRAAGRKESFVISFPTAAARCSDDLCGSGGWGNSPLFVKRNEKHFHVAVSVSFSIRGAFFRRPEISLP